MKLKKLMVLFLLGFSVIGLSACGDDDDTTGTDDNGEDVTYLYTGDAVLGQIVTAEGSAAAVVASFSTVTDSEAVSTDYFVDQGLTDETIASITQGSFCVTGDELDVLTDDESETVEDGDAGDDAVTPLSAGTLTVTAADDTQVVVDPLPEELEFLYAGNLGDFTQSYTVAFAGADNTTAGVTIPAITVDTVIGDTPEITIGGTAFSTLLEADTAVALADLETTSWNPLEGVTSFTDDQSDFAYQAITFTGITGEVTQSVTCLIEPDEGNLDNALGDISLADAVAGLESVSVVLLQNVVTTEETEADVGLVRVQAFTSQSGDVTVE